MDGCSQMARILATIRAHGTTRLRLRRHIKPCAIGPSKAQTLFFACKNPLKSTIGGGSERKEGSRREMGSDSEADKSIKEKKKVLAVAPIAKPLAGKKLGKRTLKLVRRASEAKCLKRGVKEVVKSIRRGHKGLCVIAGNISPIDVITHVPILCEEADIPYIYVPSKEDLASAGVTKRPTCCVLVLTKSVKVELDQKVQEKLQADYNQVVEEVKQLAASLF